jgi:hypothetical protein
MGSLFMRNVIVWDIETVPDLKGFAAANGHGGTNDDEVRAELGDKFPKHIYHSIICIGALVAQREDGGLWIVDALGAPPGHQHLPHTRNGSIKRACPRFSDRRGATGSSPGGQSCRALICNLAYSPPCRSDGGSHLSTSVPAASRLDSASRPGNDRRSDCRGSLVVSYLAGQDVNSQVLQKAMADPSSDSVWSTVLSWRRLLQATAALSVKVSMPAILGRAAVQAGGSDSLPLRGGEILPDPDFSLLSPKHPYLIGIRPHRVGGVRLETKISTPPVPPVFPELRQARLAPSRGGAVQQLAAVLRIKPLCRLRCCALAVCGFREGAGEALGVRSIGRHSSLAVTTGGTSSA